MAWIESHSLLIDHKKVREVAQILEIKPVLLIGHLHCLWHKVIDLCEDGDISTWNEGDVSYYSKWEGDPKTFYDALKNRFIDEKNGYKLIHDWLDYAWKYLYSKYHTNNPKLLETIRKKYKGKGKPLGHTKGYTKGPLPTNLTNLTNQPNLTNSTQADSLLTQFPNSLQEKLKVYIERVKQKNKSKVITEGRRLTLLTELWNTRERCAADDIFGYAVEMAINYDACVIGYVNAVIKNKKAGKSC